MKDAITGMNPAARKATRSLSRARHLLLGASLAIGLAQSSILPPGEGFDEPAHLSYIQQLAETGTWPSRGSPLSSDVEAYERIAPTPYASSQPYDRNNGWTYRDFFHASDPIVAQGRSATHDGQDPARGWHAGSRDNWEAQHPPLYYALLAPLFAASKSWSLIDRLFLLRVVSYGFAWIALCLCVLGARRTVSRLAGGKPAGALAEWIALAPALWPFVFPAWFPEMARLGNDSLVILCSAGIWFGWLRWSDSDRVRDHVKLGLLCGIGLLTKGILFPLVGVVLVFQGLSAWRDARGRQDLLRRLLKLVALAASVVAVAGWWYLAKLHETGNLLGSHDITIATEANGILSALGKPQFALSLVRGWLNIFGTFIWSGTWSLVQPPPASVVPFALLACGIAAGYVASLRSFVGSLPAFFPGATLATCVAGLGWYVVVLIAAYGHFGTPGWYLHALVPVLAPIVGIGLWQMSASRVLRIALSIASIYPVLFIPFVAGIEVLTFAGCGAKQARRTGFDFQPLDVCLPAGRSIYRNLEVLGSPGPAAAFFVVGMGLLVSGMATLVRNGSILARQPSNGRD